MMTIEEGRRILGVPEDTTIDLIKKQYRKLAKKFHPDLGGSHEIFIKVNEAYSILLEQFVAQMEENEKAAEFSEIIRIYDIIEKYSLNISFYELHKIIKNGNIEKDIYNGEEFEMVNISKRLVSMMLSKVILNDVISITIKNSFNKTLVYSNTVNFKTLINISNSNLYSEKIITEVTEVADLNFKRGIYTIEIKANGKTYKFRTIKGSKREHLTYEIPIKEFGLIFNVGMTI